jgi:hypothetical protein
MAVAAWIMNCVVSSVCFTLRRHFFTGDVYGRGRVDYELCRFFCVFYTAFCVFYTAPSFFYRGGRVDVAIGTTYKLKGKP